MLLPSHKIERAAIDPEEEGRYALNFVHVNARKKRLEASDGKILAVVPAELEGEDEILLDELVPIDTTKRARKAAGKRAPRRLSTTPDGKSHGMIDGASVPKPEGTTPFPDIDAVTPDPGDRVPDLILNPRLFLALHEAISSGEYEDQDRAPSIALWFKRDGEGRPDFTSGIYAQAVDGNGAYGVIMPIGQDSRAPILPVKRAGKKKEKAKVEKTPDQSTPAEAAKPVEVGNEPPPQA